MDIKEFKFFFDTTARTNGFNKAFGGWFKESEECIITLDLQRSYYSSLYYLNIKIFIQGIYGRQYVKSKHLLQDTGDLFRRDPNEYNDCLNFNISMNDSFRKQRIESLFTEFIVPFTNKGLTCTGLIELAAQGKIFLLPAVKKYLIGENDDFKL